MPTLTLDISCTVRPRPDGGSDCQLTDLKRSTPISREQFAQIAEQIDTVLEHDERMRRTG